MQTPAKPGPKGPSAELIATVVGIRRSAEQGCLRRILQQHYTGLPPGDGPSWLTTLAQAKDSLWSLDLFSCESIMLRSYWVMLIIDVFSRRCIGFAVARGDIDGPIVCRMFNCARASQGLPKYLSTDHDPLFRFHRWLANLRVLDIEEIKSVPYAPVSHPFVERMIRTVREELLDQVLFWNELHLERKLAAFRIYYNRYRVHSGIDGIPPEQDHHCHSVSFAGHPTATAYFNYPLLHRIGFRLLQAEIARQVLPARLRNLSLR